MQKPAQTKSVSADVKAADILQLIADYQRSAKVLVASLHRQFKVTNLLRAWRTGKIPKTGLLVKPKGKFNFHGIGCCFEVGKRTVDVDFGPNGRHDGFDSWRLGYFASSAFEWRDISAEQIERGLRELEVDGLIEAGTSPPLYYFRDEVEPPALRRRTPKRRVKVGN